jgi:NAD(P)H-hydrate epimerase
MFTLSRNQVRELDRRAIEEYGIPGIVLMENAGRGCAELLMKLNPTKKPTVILCGPGNNGGDGFVMARHLDNAGWSVEICLFADQNRLSRDSAEMRARLSLAIRVYDYPPGFHCGLGDVWREQELLRSVSSWHDRFIVDALFGTGLNRPIEWETSMAVTTVNAARTIVLAIDIPSGLDCDTGEPLGPTIRATHTATFVAPKRGFLNPKAKEWTGEVHVIDIGAPRKLVDEYRN